MAVTMRLETPQDLAVKRDCLVATRDAAKISLSVCGGTGCRAQGSLNLLEEFRRRLEERGRDDVEVRATGCHGFCENGPLVVVFPKGIFYHGVQLEDVDAIIENTVCRNDVVDRLLYRDPVSAQTCVTEDDVPFYAKQKRIVLRMNGKIDPVDIDDYIAAGGYVALAKGLTEMSPENVIDEVTQAGLRGRGGAGFPTGRKWAICRAQPHEEKYVICNGDEGDPGAFMDRSIMEGNPHSVIEGMILGGYAIGARQGYIYVRGEYPLAVTNLGMALDQAHEYGVLGETILGSEFSFDIEVVRGAGAFVCGEETALIASMEGETGNPMQRPPFPAQSGLLGKPTNINNVETWANVPVIVERGAHWFAGIGTEKSKGTKVFSLVGKVKNTGLVEVPMGTTLREIVYDVGGGVRKDRAFKAVQIGGPSGGCIPARLLDLPVDFEQLTQAGAMMGSGGLIVMDERTCMVDITRYFLSFLVDESCGRCAPCREGLVRILSVVTRICEGDGQEGDIELLQEWAEYVKESALCQLGGTAPNSVLATLRYFREEYEEHIREKRCRASVCEGLFEAPCSHACPAEVNIPQYLGLVSENKLDDAVNVIRLRNPFVSVCGRVCDAQCERRCRRSDLDEPLAIRSLKRYAIDHAQEVSPPPEPVAVGKREVAIVGSGPGGLSCAYFLALMGRSSVVFEALPIPGGMLAVGIPEYRLPKAALQADIDYILAHGVELRTSAPVGSMEELRAQGFRAIFVATGAHTDRVLGVDGEDLDGVVGALAFLRGRALGEPVPCGKRVAVIGGGNAAVDTARSAFRLGAEKVLLLYRRTRAEMPAYEEEIEAALEEGMELHELVAPACIIGKDNAVTGIEMTRMQLGDTDDSGRRRPVPIEGSAFVVECDMVVPAIGQHATINPVQDAVELSRWGTVNADILTGGTSAPDVFSGGDCVSGGTTVIEAIGAGRKAAVAIDRLLGGSGELPPNVGPSMRRPSEEELEKTLGRARVEETMTSVEERLGGFTEVVCDMADGAAHAEAGRCMRCDLERMENAEAERK